MNPQLIVLYLHYFYFTGVEPWTFYFLNGFLNFNLVFPMALLALPACVSTLRLNKQSARPYCGTEINEKKKSIPKN